MHSPHAFDASTFEIWTPLLHGGRIIIPPPGALEVDVLRDLITRHHITGTFITAALFTTIAEQDPTVFAGMRSVCAGGDAATPGVMETVATTCPHTTVLNAYGPTETTTFAALHHVQPTTPDHTHTTPPPIGRPLDGMHLYILDPNLNLVPHGATGELYIAGAGLARGYLNHPDHTATRFIPNPHTNNGTRMYRTGDLARWNNNTIEYLGRTDHQIKLRGFRIELGEIENTLTTQPQINAACVLLREDRPGDKRLTAYLTTNTNTQHRHPSTAHHTRRNPPPVHDPDSVHHPRRTPPHPQRQNRPQSPTHTRHHHHAVQPPATTAPTARRATPAKTSCARSSPTPSACPRSASTRASSTSADTPSSPPASPAASAPPSIPTSPFARSSTTPPSAISPARSTSTRRVPHPPLPLPNPRPAYIPLSPAQRRLWFLNRLEGPSATYNVPIILSLHGDLDVSALDHALRDLIERHESLRTIYPEQHDGRPRQLILDPDATGFALREIVAAANADDAERLTIEAASEPFDVQTDLPTRATLLRATPEDGDDHTLVLVIHHIAADGWSMAPLARDLETAYRARTSGQAPEWTPLPVQYADFTLWQHEVLGDQDDPDSAVTAQLDYWRETLAGLPELLDLPLDHPRPATTDYQGNEVSFELPAALHEALHQLARQTNTSLFMVLQAAVAIVLSKHGGGTDIPLGTPIAGRTDQPSTTSSGSSSTPSSYAPTSPATPRFTSCSNASANATWAPTPIRTSLSSNSSSTSTPRARRTTTRCSRRCSFCRTRADAELDLPGLTTEARSPQTTVAKFDLTFAFAPGRPAARRRRPQRPPSLTRPPRPPSPAHPRARRLRRLRAAAREAGVRDRVVRGGDRAHLGGASDARTHRVEHAPRNPPVRVECPGRG